MNLTREQMLALARDIVTKWESIDAKVESFLSQFWYQEENKATLRAALTNTYREAVGGEDVYVLAKAAIKEFES